MHRFAMAGSGPLDHRPARRRLGYAAIERCSPQLQPTRDFHRCVSRRPLRWESRAIGERAGFGTGPAIAAPHRILRPAFQRGRALRTSGHRQRSRGCRICRSRRTLARPCRSRVNPGGAEAGRARWGHRCLRPPGTPATFLPSTHIDWCAVPTYCRSSILHHNYISSAQ